MSERYRATARGLSRRSLFASTGLLGVAAFAANALNGPPGVRHVLLRNAYEEITPVVSGPVIRHERVYSAARGREVDVVTILPPGVRVRDLPISILLHGLKGNAHTAAGVGGIGHALATAVTARLTPPFGFVAVDGGDSYWHENHPGDDPMSMLLDEVPHWLAARGHAETPFACTGVSMGGFGAMLYARRRTERGDPVRAVATISPGLLTSWADMRRRNAFASESQWAALDPLRNIGKIGPAPMALWCGDRDKFVHGCREFIARAPLEIASITPGGHTDAYWRTVTPEVVAFLGRHVG
ncbi:alpha/beta hydrolase family protein [Nocardia sp. CC227C]|uniref:alpha/beta hydrolase n=1 Tax=Nocardia sp. CC227C TaxID=3044562 RepID=UPI00278BCD83|nr:alpha/beta hydrolase-fold protein [Nocardia sp. CC227C]